MTKIELSIIAVVINNLEVTQRFVSSIRQYTKGNYELILIDNASKDKKAIRYLKKVADVYYRFKRRTDLAKTWNKGIKLSKGKFIAIVNNDTVVGKDWFKPLRETLTKHKKVGLVHPLTFALFREYIQKYKPKKYFEILSKPAHKRKPIKLRKFVDIVWGEFCVFKRKALKDIGGFCELYKIASAEDLEMNFQLYSKGYDIYLDPRVHIHHEGAITSSKLFGKKKTNRIWARNFKLFKSRWPKYTKGW